MAFQKAEGLSRDGVAGPATQAALATAVRPVPLDPNGNHIEIDLARQILLVVEGGQPRWALNTSPGHGAAYASPRARTAAAPPPVRSFALARAIAALRPHPIARTSVEQGQDIALRVCRVRRRY